MLCFDQVHITYPTEASHVNAFKTEDLMIGVKYKNITGKAKGVQQKENEQQRKLNPSCQPFAEGLYQIKTCVDWQDRYLSADIDGTTVEVYSKPESKRQNWYLTPIPNTCYYNIVVSGGVSCRSRKLLSVTPSGLKVDLWYRDDKSGRQRWKFTEILNSDMLYHIIVAGGVKRRRSILGVRRELLFKKPTTHLKLFHPNPGMYFEKNSIRFCWHIFRLDRPPP